MCSTIPLCVSLILTLNWPIYSFGPPGLHLSNFGLSLVLILATLLYLNIFLKQNNGVRGFRNIFNHADTKIGAVLAIIFGPAVILFSVGFMSVTIDHWQLRLFADNESFIEVRVNKLDNNKFNWSTWKVRVENLETSKGNTLFLSKRMISDSDIGKCLRLSGRENEYGLYIEQKTYISCDG